MDSSPLLLDQLKDVIAIVMNFVDVRYLEVAGLVVLVYDSILTSRDEFVLVWKSRGLSTGKLVYLLNRYLALAYIMFYNKPSQALNCCSTLITLIPSFDLVSTALGNALILYELTILWDVSGIVVFLMSSGYAFATLGMAVFTALTITSMRSTLNIQPGLPLCVFQQSKVVLGAWIFAVALDLYSFSLLLANALSRPRTVNEKLLRVLINDGLFFFSTVLGLRVLGIGLIIAAPPTFSHFAIVGFGASITTAVVSRLYLDLQLKKLLESWKDPLYRIVTQGAGETELQAEVELQKLTA